MVLNRDMAGHNIGQTPSDVGKTIQLDLRLGTGACLSLCNYDRCKCLITIFQPQSVDVFDHQPHPPPLSKSCFQRL